jgi:hypothetical protein
MNYVIIYHTTYEVRLLLWLSTRLGLKRQDNDLIVIESDEAAETFKRNFEARFASGETLLPSMGR